MLRDNPVLNGTDIRNPEQNFDDQGGGDPIVTMEFSDDGRRAFAERRARSPSAARTTPRSTAGSQDPIGASHHFAIRLDNELDLDAVHQLPRAPGRDRRPERRADLRRLHHQTAQDLANLLKIGALPLRLELISRSQVSATLGQQALDQGLVAGLAGFAIVAIFLIVFYRVLGVIATLALGVYALYLFALIKLIPITLTLPGIAGLILTIGVAADANIVIFERVKEEMRAGRSISAGIAQGYKKGFSTIVDANIVTLLVAFILFILATAGVKGFAFVLGIGTLVSLFTAVLATQAILLSMRNSRLLQLAVGARRGQAAQADHVRLHGRVEVVLLRVGRDPAGLRPGDRRQRAELRHRLRVRHADHRRAGARGDGRARCATRSRRRASATPRSRRREPGARRQRRPDLRRAVGPHRRGHGRAGRRSSGSPTSPTCRRSGPTFGETVANSALIAIIASLTVISVYIALRFEWKYAVPVLIALMHDILITAGVYSLVGREVTTSTVAALLTILGFSLYDTIIVFDRIRENVPRMPSAAFSQIVNRSMSEVIVRSLATSFCTVLPVLALFFFGGETLQDFAFALIVGTHLGHLLVRVHRRPGAHALEGARVGLPRAPAPDPRGVRLRARLRGRRRRRPGRRRARAAPPPHRPARPGSVAGRLAARSSTTWCANLGVEPDAAPAPAPAPAPAGAAPAAPGGRAAGARAGTGGAAAGGAAPGRARRPRATATPGAARARRGRPGARRRSRATGRTGGRADGRARVGHDRPRHLALHVFVPDRFWGGIVGAFVGALIGSVLLGWIISGFSVPGQDETDLLTAVEAVPGALLGIAAVYFYGASRGNEPV